MKDVKFKIFSTLIEAMFAALTLGIIGLQLLMIVSVFAVSVFGAIWLARALLGWF